MSIMQLCPRVYDWTYDLQSPEERDLLVRVLDSDMREARVEYRRTEDPDFRREVAGEEAMLKGLLAKLRELSD